MAFEPFDFSRAMRSLCEDVVQGTPELAHVHMPQVAVCFAQTRSRQLHGMQAKLTPLRFEGGALTTHRRGTVWTVRRMSDGPTELLYILTFYLPRFLDQSLDEKLITVFHELFHISPVFNGDIRRMEGRYHVHSHSQQEYDRQMGVLARRYLEGPANPSAWRFLEEDFQSLNRRHGGVVGLKLPIPRLIRLDEQRSAG